MKEHTITIMSVKAITVAKIGGVLGAVCGGAISMLIAISYLLTLSQLKTVESELGSIATESSSLSNGQFPVQAIIAVVIIYALAGFFLGYVGSFVFNFVAPRWGGLQLTIKE